MKRGHVTLLPPRALLRYDLFHSAWQLLFCVLTRADLYAVTLIGGQSALHKREDRKKHRLVGALHCVCLLVWSPLHSLHCSGPARALIGKKTLL
jgi:hypothetical protein